MTNDHPFGETIYSYSRAQAIEDGELVDLGHVDSIRQHWKHPFACTSAVWSIMEEASQEAGRTYAGFPTIFPRWQSWPFSTRAKPSKSSSR